MSKIFFSSFFILTACLIHPCRSVMLIDDHVVFLEANTLEAFNAHEFSM